MANLNISPLFAHEYAANVAPLRRLTNEQAMHQSLMRRLASNSSLSLTDEAALKRLCVNVRSSSRHRDVAREGDTSGGVQILLSGVAARYVILPNGSRRITAILIPGDTINELGGQHAVLDHNVTAISECIIAEPSIGDFEECVSSSESLKRAFWKTMVVDNAVMRQWLASAGRRTALEMIAHLLCEMHVRMGIIGLEKDSAFALPLTQEDIGDATGLTSVHVNRVFRSLRENMLVERSGYEVRLLDLAKLKSLAGFSAKYLDATGD